MTPELWPVWWVASWFSFSITTTLIPKEDMTSTSRLIIIKMLSYLDISMIVPERWPNQQYLLPLYQDHMLNYCSHFWLVWFQNIVSLQQSLGCQQFSLTILFIFLKRSSFLVKICRRDCCVLCKFCSTFLPIITSSVRLSTLINTF